MHIKFLVLRTSSSGDYYFKFEIVAGHKLQPIDHRVGVATHEPVQLALENDVMVKNCITTTIFAKFLFLTYYQLSIFCTNCYDGFYT